MDTQQVVLKIFLIYIFIKALVLCPLGWMTLCVWWNDRQEAKRTTQITPKTTAHITPQPIPMPAKRATVILVPQSDAA
jgi:hypothetical protein